MPPFYIHCRRSSVAPPPPSSGGARLQFYSRLRIQAVATDGNTASGQVLLVSDRNKNKSMLICTYSTLWMIGGFVFIVYMGHLYIWAMVVVRAF